MSVYGDGVRSLMPFDKLTFVRTVYALCQRVQEDETDVLEVSDGWLTVSEVLEAGR